MRGSPMNRVKNRNKHNLLKDMFSADTTQKGNVHSWCLKQSPSVTVSGYPMKLFFGPNCVIQLNQTYFNI